MFKRTKCINVVCSSLVPCEYRGVFGMQWPACRALWLSVAGLTWWTEGKNTSVPQLIVVIVSYHYRHKNSF